MAVCSTRLSSLEKYRNKQGRGKRLELSARERRGCLWFVSRIENLPSVTDAVEGSIEAQRSKTAHRNMHEAERIVISDYQLRAKDGIKLTLKQQRTLNEQTSTKNQKGPRARRWC